MTIDPPRGDQSQPHRHEPGDIYDAADSGRAPGAVRRENVYAALDLGTNNCRLLVARPSRHGFRVVDPVRPGMRSASDRASSRLTTCTPSCAKMRALAAAYSSMPG